MAAIERSVEIARSPEDVFAYVTDIASHPEWQREIVAVEIEGDGRTHVGTRWTDTRRGFGGARAFTYVITEFDPQRLTAFEGGNELVRIAGSVEVEATQEGSGSVVAMRLEFEGRGFGKVLAPLFRRRARAELEDQQAALKRRLEGGALS